MATPIGNLGDIILLALSILKGADVIACEDAHITRRLLFYYCVGTSTTAYHDYNAQTVLPRLMKRLQKGEIVALTLASLPAGGFFSPASCRPNKAPDGENQHYRATVDGARCGRSESPIIWLTAFALIQFSFRPSAGRVTLSMPSA